MAAATTGPSISKVKEGYRRIRLANLTKLIDVELDLLKESFQEAKSRIDPMIAQINEARNKFDDLLLQGGGGGGEMMMDLEMERELRDLKQTTSKLKSKIPFNLITTEYQPSADPNIIFQPRTQTCKPTTPTSSNPPLVVDNVALWGDKSEVLDYSSDVINKYPYTLESTILLCLLAFPEGAFIKASLLYSYAKGIEEESVVSTVCELVSKGLIKSVYKKHSSTTLDGFWMDPFVHRTLKDRLAWELELQYLVNNSSSISGDDIIYIGSADTLTLSADLLFLHLGKWQKSPTHPNIEMPDPNVYLKYADNMRWLVYISFRGVSVMKELPLFITQLKDQTGRIREAKLRYLRVLDLKACHHLEVIPSDIGILWHSLTHLDMSECYFLDHMPASLSRLIHLRVLKGFFVGETNNNEEESSCTLQDLSSLTWLMKIHIYTSLKTFPSENHLKTLQEFRDLRNLTICWGGSPTRDENRELIPHYSPATLLVRFYWKFSFNLEKLDLRGVPEMGTRDWLRPSNFEKLEKLYIRGGQLCHLRHDDQAQKAKQSAAVKAKKEWSVKILRLRHLSKLEMDWSEGKDYFPNVVGWRR